uniref:Mediator of RNA polymerase II transcription subunit 27 n=1 Tax=Parascaris univalens TaxID=6257 RepID=A0A915A804_PARUN
MSQQPTPQQQFASLAKHSDQCLSAVKLLRSEVFEVHRKIWQSLGAEGETLEKNRKLVEEKAEMIGQLYEKLENHARNMPASTPMTMHMERLSRLLHDAHIDPHTSQLYDNLLDASIWIDTNIQFLQLLVEFLRSLVGGRRRSIMTDKAISYSNFTAMKSPQFIFEQTLATALRDPNNKKMVQSRYLERSTLSAIVEFKFGQFVDKQYVCLLKMLVVVNNGLFEFVQIYAPHEEWTYLDINEKQVDVLKESRYLVYRKMSVQANIHLMQTIIPCMDIRNAHTISYILNIFHKFASAFEVKCRYCNKVMKDFLPPLIFDPRNLKTALHESCR